MNKILVIAVAAVVVAGGVCGAVFLMNSGKGSDDFSFKDCHFDLSGAKSLVIAKDSAVSATNSMVSKNYGGNVGAVTASLGAANGYDYSLYKTDEYGKYIKVLLYGNDDDQKDDAIDFKMVPMLMEISDDGEYILMAFAKSDRLGVQIIDSETVYFASPATYVIIVASTGKVYQLENGNGWTQSNANTIGMNYYKGTEFNKAYSIIDSFDSKLLLKYRGDDKTSYSIAYVDNEELVVKEITNNNVIKNMGDRYRMLNNGILLVETNGPDYETYMVFLDGGLQKYNNDDFTYYCNNLCTAVEYYDDDTKFFASSYTVVESLNKITNKLETKKIDLTKEQSFELMKNNLCRSEIYREVSSNEITVYVMETVSHLYKFKLKSDCTVEDLGRIDLPAGMKLGKNPGAASSPLDDAQGIINGDVIGDYLSGYTLGGSPVTLNGYMVLNGHICQAWVDPFPFSYDTPVTDTIISGSTLFKIDSTKLKVYDLKTGPADDYSIPNLVKIDSMNLLGGKIVIKGVTNTGSILKGSLDLKTGVFDTNYSNVLVEVRLAALN